MNDNNSTNTNADEAPVNLTDEQAISLFIEGLMEEKGVAVGSDELQKDIFNDLKTRLMEEIDRSLISELPDEKLEELQKMTENGGKIEPEVIAKMIEEANLNVEEITAGTMAKFRELYLGVKEDGAE